MSSNPTQAYEAAKLRRDKNQKAIEQENAEREAFPALAESRLNEICAALTVETPAQLRLDIEPNLAGGMDRREGRRGIKGVYLRLYEGPELIAEGSIGVASNHDVELVDFTPNERGKQRGILFEATTFDKLDTKLAIDFLSHLISEHVR